MKKCHLLHLHKVALKDKHIFLPLISYTYKSIFILAHLRPHYFRVLYCHPPPLYMSTKGLFRLLHHNSYSCEKSVCGPALLRNPSKEQPCWAIKLLFSLARSFNWHSFGIAVIVCTLVCYMLNVLTVLSLEQISVGFCITFGFSGCLFF